MKFKIKEINLLRYRWILILSLMFSIIISIFLISSKPAKEITFLKDYTFIAYTILNLILGFAFIELLKKYYTRNIEIVMNKKEFILNNKKIFPYEDIDTFKVKTSFTNFPSFKIRMRDDYTFKFYCYNKADNNFETFVNELQNLTK